jgi:hypothetical protein
MKLCVRKLVSTLLRRWLHYGCVARNAVYHEVSWTVHVVFERQSMYMDKELGEDTRIEAGGSGVGMV